MLLLCVTVDLSVLNSMENYLPVPEIIDPVFAKTSQNARFLLSENERFGLVFVKTGSINSSTVVSLKIQYMSQNNWNIAKLDFISVHHYRQCRVNGGLLLLK